MYNKFGAKLVKMLQNTKYITKFAAFFYSFNYKSTKTSSKMVKFGLLGHPLGHSFSQQFHNKRFADLGIEAIYENFDLEDISEFPKLLQNEPELKGLNVTIPYKQAVMQFLDELDPLAERIGAVNVIKIEGNHLKGYNSDIIGFRDSIKPMLHEKAIEAGGALVLGTGGASKAICEALREMGIKPTYVSRTPAEGRLTYSDLSPEVIASNKIIVNCTPLGMFPKIDTCPDIPYELLTSEHICFDAVYNPAETLFMKKAASQGAAVKCGYEMLVGQAIESYRIWTEK